MDVRYALMVALRAVVSMPMKMRSGMFKEARV